MMFLPDTIFCFSCSIPVTTCPSSLIIQTPEGQPPIAYMLLPTTPTSSSRRAKSIGSSVNQVFPTLRWASYIAPKGNPPEGERPVAYIVILTNKEKTSIQGASDAAAAIENIILTAMEEGIGSCWLMSVGREELRRILNIPKHCIIDSVIALGYPLESPKVEETKDSIKYWKDEKGVLHVPKRRLEDILHRNGY